MAADGMALSARNVYAKEATKNTREVPDHHIEFVSFTPTGGPAWIPSTAHRGRRGIARVPAAGNKNFTYSKTFGLVPQSMGEQLEHLWGTNVTTGAGPTYTHTISPNNDRLSLTDQFNWSGFDGGTPCWEYTGAMCASGSLNINASGDGDLVLITTNEVAHNLTAAGTPVAASYPTISNRFTSVQSSLTLAGAAVPFTQFTLNWNNNLNIETKSKSTNAGLADIRPSGLQEFTGSLEADYSATLQNYFLNRTENAAVLTISDGTHSLVITMNVVYTGSLGGIPESGPIRQPLEFQCVHATADASAFTAVLINGDAAA